MKIYPSKHRIKQVAGSNIDRDITVPLAYVNNENTTYKISRKVNDAFSATTKKEVLPNQKLDNENVLLFDEYGNPANSSTVINRIDENYYYYPNNMIEFTPLQFSYKVTAKKEFSYSISKKFNMNITCLDDMERMYFINRISKILMAPSKKNGLPNNITINKDSTNLESFKYIDYDNTDFIILESNDGLNYNFVPDEIYDEKDEIQFGAAQTIAYNTFFEANINTWIVADEHYKYPITHGFGCDVVLKSPMVSKIKKFHVKDYYNINDPAFKGLTIHNLFENDICPILLIEHANQAFEILCSAEIFAEENINSYKTLIYEVLMYVYCNSYKTSKYVNEYITYSLPDYEVKSNQLNKKTSFVSNKNFNQLP